MSEYVIRKDNIAEMYSNEDGPFDTEEILEKYPYIVESMDGENYTLQNDFCYVFYEILSEDKVVGFTTLDFIDSGVIVLSDCYILPEFRDKSLFYDELSKLLNIAPEFGILQPTRKMVELLIDYSFAKEVGNNLVVSGIDFYFDEFEARTNKSEGVVFNLPHSNFYDLSICSTVLVYEGEVVYHNQHPDDLKNYGKRKKLSKHYFKNIKKQFKRNKNEYNQLISTLKDNLPIEKMTYEEFIGDGEGLSDFLSRAIESELLSYNEALDIQNQIIEEYESGLIDDDTLEDRLMSLLVGEDYLAHDDEVAGELFDILGEDLSSELLQAAFDDDEDSFKKILANAFNRDKSIQTDLDGLFMDGEDINPFDFNLNSPYPVAEKMWGRSDKYKLDDTFYGKDYPISYDNHIFNVLNALKSGDNLNNALQKENMPGAMGSHAIDSLLYHMNLIENNSQYNDWNEYAHECLNVSDLKDILRKNNLKVSGRKQELIDRLIENEIPLDESGDVRITENGEEFLKNYEWVNVYNNCLSSFDFNDYSKYLDEHDGDFKNITLKYIDAHLKLAKKEGDEEYIDDCIKAKELVKSSI